MVGQPDDDARAGHVLTPVAADVLPVRRLLGVPLRAATMEQVVDLAGQAIATRRRLLIGVVNAAKVVNMRRDARLREAVLAADCIFADGMSVVWASRILRRALPQRVAGIDLMVHLLERGSRQCWRVFLLGATQDVLDAVVQRVRRDYPGVVLAGAHHGYFQASDEPGLVDQIRASRADVLFAAMSSPKKECFLARWAAALDVPVLHGVGGAFDVLAGKVRRAPQGWQRLGLEWLYRVLQEPGRLWRRYLVTNTLFAGLLLAELLRPGRGARSVQRESCPPPATRGGMQSNG